MTSEDLRIKLFRDIARLDENVRHMIGLDGEFDTENPQILKPLRYDISDVSVLPGLREIRPLKTAEDVLALTEKLIEDIEKPVEIEILLDGISRFAGNLPDTAAERAAELLRRIEKITGENKAAENGIFAADAGFSRCLRGLFVTLLSGAPRTGLAGGPGGTVLPLMFYAQRIAEINKHIAAGRKQPLLSLPTHENGWIDPQILAERLLDMQEKKQMPPPLDLMQALLRLAPDGRNAALQKATALNGHTGRVLRWALGGNEGPQAADRLHYDIWIAAARARDPRGNFKEDFAGLLLDDFLPDSLEKAQYHWRAGLGYAAGEDGKKRETPRLLIRVEPYISPDEESRIWDAYHADSRLAGIAKTIFRKTKTLMVGDFPTDSRRIPTTLLHRTLRNEEHAVDNLKQGWSTRWLALLWPLNLESFFTLGVHKIMRGFSGADNANSADTGISAFLEPLAESNRPWTDMSRLALAAALVSPQKDISKTAAALLRDAVTDGRADAAEFARVLARINDGGWLKAETLCGALKDIAASGLPHKFFVHTLLQEFILRSIDLPQNARPLFALMEKTMTETAQGPKPELMEKLADLDTEESRIATAGLAAIPAGNPALALEAETRTIETRIRHARRLRADTVAKPQSVSS
ncbi:MAG: hypothetical protein EA357_04390 [Micavibrio sp.]|nr:MAG: hypothetical protein EA357_04390 [Micavibrio sp.]